MQPFLQGTVTVFFIRQGLSKKNQKPYLQVSNGLSQFFIAVPDDYDTSEFSPFTEGDQISLNVKCRVGSDYVTLI